MKVSYSKQSKPCMKTPFRPFSTYTDEFKDTLTFSTYPIAPTNPLVLQLCAYMAILGMCSLSSKPQTMVKGLVPVPLNNKRSLVKDIVKVCEITGLKFNRRGYRSIGLRVPDVIIIDWKC